MHWPGGSVTLIIVLHVKSQICATTPATATTTIPLLSPSTPQIATIIDGFIANVTEPVELLLGQTGASLATTFSASTAQLCDLELFSNGSYAQNFNTTKSGIFETLAANRKQNLLLRNQARAALQQALEQLRFKDPRHAEANTEYRHDIIKLAYIYRQYERGYGFVHSEYRADVQCNYALMYDRGLAVENLTETENTAHIRYQTIVQDVQRINVANRRDIEEQTQNLLRNLAKSWQLVARHLSEKLK